MVNAQKRGQTQCAKTRRLPMRLQVSYQVKNWKQYNQALRQRGNLQIWFNEDVITPPTPKPGRGRPTKFSQGLIELALTVRYLFHLPLRAAQGFVDSLFSLQKIDFKCCDYSLLSRRAKSVGKKLSAMQNSKNKVLHLAVDSTGLKVFGEGEWKTRIHGSNKRRTWKKLHLAVDVDSHKILGSFLSKSKCTDGKALPKILKNIRKIGFAYGDGAYDQIGCYEELYKRKARLIIPPRKDARTDRVVWTPAEQLKSLNAKAAKDLGTSSWKVGTGYHRRSLVETAMWRFKKIFTGNLSSRNIRNQRAEIAIKVAILNKLTELGMPDSKMNKKLISPGLVGEISQMLGTPRETRAVG